MVPTPSWIAVGYVARTHGVRGSLWLHWHDAGTPLADFPSVLQLTLPSGQIQEHEVTAHRLHKGGTLVDLKRVITMDAAQALKGASVAVREQDVPIEDDGEVYLYRLMGSQCVSTEGRALGTLDAIYDHGATVVLGIGSGQQELLVPLLETTLRSRRPAGQNTPQVLELELLPGFFDP